MSGETTARWEDYVDVFMSPAELFRRRARSSLTHPVVTLLVASMVLYFVMLPANSELFRQNVSPNPESQAFFERWGLALQIAGGLFAPITVLLAVAWAALVLWLAARVLDINAALRDTFLIATYAAFIYLLYQAAAGLVVMLKTSPVDPVVDLSFGILRFTGGDAISPILQPLVGRLDVFAIWQAAMWAIGLRVVAGASTGKALAAAGASWLLVAIPRMLMGAFPRTSPVTGS